MRLLCTLLVIGLFLVSCSLSPSYAPPPDWTYANLRALDPADSISPSLDLVGMYTRQVGSTFQIRLDLLESATEPDYDLYLLLDTSMGGTTSLPIQAIAGLAWDILISIPARSPLNAITPSGGAIPGLQLDAFRDTFLDTLVVSINSSALPGGFLSSRPGYVIQTFLTPAQSSRPVDILGPTRMDSHPPAQLPVLFAFWNTFLAYTPAQSLRSWDGAHTGPYGGRHGLRNLLKAVENTQSPVYLLDLKAPTSLSALDYMDALPYIRDLAGQGLVNLPDAVSISDGYPNQIIEIPDWLLVRSASESRTFSSDFGLPASPFLFTPRLPGESSPGEPWVQGGDYRLLFLSEIPDSPSATEVNSDNIEITRWRDKTVIPLPISLSSNASTDGSISPQATLSSQEATKDGPSLETRLRLLQSALDGNNPNGNAGNNPMVFLLGGDLPQSAWGDPVASLNTLRYLAARPWIRFFTANDLITTAPDRPFSVKDAPSYDTGIDSGYIPSTPQGIPVPGDLTAQDIHDQILRELSHLPANQVTQLTWQVYESLVSSPAYSGLPYARLRLNYLGQLGHLLAAARWASYAQDELCNPSLTLPCAVDLDWDGENEIILASSNLFAIFEAEGGYLTFAFARGRDGIHQIIAPSYQFFIGLSDPSVWDYSVGIAGDPSQLRGAFSDIASGFLSPSWERFLVDTSTNQVTFTSPQGTLLKTFTLLSSGLLADYEANDPYTVQIPLALDPWIRFTPAWGARFHESFETPRLSWGLEQGFHVTIHSPAEISFRPFTGSFEAIAAPENPNFGYPPGHYLPFPMALVNLTIHGKVSIRMDFSP